MSADGDGVQRLRRLLREGGGLMATLVEDARELAAGGIVNGAPREAKDGGGSATPAQLAASGPRARARGEDYELLIEAIYEGYLLHYATPRAMRVPEADLRLLAGDRLYAIGLSQLVEIGDVLAVAELADTITLSALAQGAGNPALAEAVWMAGARAVGWGASAAHASAKELVRAGTPEAIDAMRTSAFAAPTSR